MPNSQINSLELATEMVAIDAVSLTADDIAQLERLILDFAAVAMCGSVQPWGRKLRDWARDQNTTGALTADRRRRAGQCGDRRAGQRHRGARL